MLQRLKFIFIYFQLLYIIKEFDAAKIFLLHTVASE